MVQALNRLAVLNPKISHVSIDGALNQAEVDARQVMAVPSIYLNGKPLYSGRMEIGEILAKIDTGNAARDAAKLGVKAPFDMLIVGGGPAGAAAAVYAARKGIRTGIVAERFGGQTLDTMGIENFVPVLETVSPKFAAALVAHVAHYGVDVMNLQRVARITPAEVPGGYATLLLDSGAKLKSRAVVLATGARWRNINVPGDVTTVPCKQIIIAAGEGSKAAHSAFDPLIRSPVPAPAPGLARASAAPAPDELALA